MMTDRGADPLARQAVAAFLEWNPFTQQDPEQLADQVAALPDVLRDALEGYFATGRLPSREYRGLSLAELEEFTGSPIQAVLWMGALFADDEAFWPTITLREGRFTIGNKDAHGAAREHSLVAGYGRALCYAVGEHLKALGREMAEPVARCLSEIETDLWIAAVASASDADDEAETLATVRRLMADARLGAPRSDEIRLADRLVRGVVAFIEADVAYAREAGWVDEALAGTSARRGPFYDPSDVARLTTALTRKASDEKEITPEVWSRTFHRVEALSPLMRKALAHTLWFGVYPRYESHGVSFADMAESGDELAVVERMDQVGRDPESGVDVLAAAKQASAALATGVEVPGDGPARSVLVAHLVAATVEFLTVLEQYGDPAVGQVLERLRRLLLDTGGATGDGSWSAEVAGARTSLAVAVGDGTGSVGRVDLRRLDDGLDLIQTARTA